MDKETIEEVEIKIEYFDSFDSDPLMVKDTIEEVEIKIEYFDSFESDPLSDKNINSLPKILDSGKECNKKRNNSTNCKVTWSIDDSGRFLCNFCDLKYSTQQTIRYHMKTKHPVQANLFREEFVKLKRNSRLRCHICKQHFREIDTLKLHVLKNHSLEDVKMSCLYCDTKFGAEDELSHHMFTQHNKTKFKFVYMCNICAYRTLSNSHFIQHKKTHEPDKTKKCKYCNYATHYLPNLKVHERIHTNEKVYDCGYTNCDYRCSTTSALRNHRLKHNPEGNILCCDRCNYKTVYRQSLKRHEDCHRRDSQRLKIKKWLTISS